METCLVAAGNTYNPSLIVLRQKGYEIWLEKGYELELEDGETPEEYGSTRWYAKKMDIVF